MGDKPEDFSLDFLANAAIHQRLASKITRNAVRRIGGVRHDVQRRNEAYPRIQWALLQKSA